MKKQSLLDNRYLLKRKVGEGGFSQVYEAEHATLGKTVAIKILTRGGESARLRSEARSLARLQHPNIVHVLDFGQDEHGLSYCVMEYVEGRTLKQAIEQDFPLSLGYVRDVCEQLCSALDFIHTRHFIHRDLKPSNVMVTKDSDKNPQVKLFDFGIAKNHMENDSSLMNLTRPGFSLGTPYYMSPEQIKGDPDLDHRTDLYSFGIILFEMLAGRPPFHAPSRFALMEMHLHQPPPDIPDRRCSPSLQACVRRLLAKQPAARYASALEVWEDLKVAFLECVALRDMPIEQQLGSVPDLSALSQVSQDSDEASLIHVDASALMEQGNRSVAVDVSGGQEARSVPSAEIGEAVSSRFRPRNAEDSVLGEAGRALPWVVPEIALQPEDEEDTAVLFMDAGAEDQTVVRDYAVTSSWQRRLSQPLETNLDLDPWQAEGDPVEAALALDDADENEDKTRVRYQSIPLQTTEETAVRMVAQEDTSAERRGLQRRLSASRSEETQVVEEEDLLASLRLQMDPFAGHPLAAMLRNEPQDDDETIFRPSPPVFDDAKPLSNDAPSDAPASARASNEHDNSDEIPFHFLPTPEGQQAAAASSSVLPVLSVSGQVPNHPSAAGSSSNSSSRASAGGASISMGRLPAVAAPNPGNRTSAVAAPNSGNRTSAVAAPNSGNRASSSAHPLPSFSPTSGGTGGGLPSVQNGRRSASSTTIALLSQEVEKPEEALSIETQRFKERGMGLVASGKLPEAEAVFREAVRKNPEDPAPHFHLGIILGKQARYREAEEAFRESIRLQPQRAGSYYNLGLALGKQDRLLETEEAFLKAIQLSPNKSVYHNELGIILGRQRRYREAEEAFLKAIQLDPLDVSPYFNLGTALGQQGNYTRAEKVLKEAIALAPQDPSLFHQLAYILKAQKKNDEATRAFLQAQSLASRQRERASE